MKGNTHGSTISLILPPFKYLCLYTEAKGTNTKWMSMENSCREMIKLREKSFPSGNFSLNWGGNIRESCAKNYLGSICFFEKAKNEGWVKSSFMCITIIYFESSQL